MYVRDEIHKSIFEFEGMILEQAIIQVKPKLVFESGTGTGYATGWMMSGIRKVGLDDCIFHACDIRKEPLDKNVELSSEEFHFHMMSSVDYLKREGYKLKFDFAFIDGSHREDVVYQELDLLNIYEGKKTIVFLHDIRDNDGPWNGWMKYVREKDSLKNWTRIAPGSLAVNMGEEELIEILKGLGPLQVVEGIKK